MPFRTSRDFYYKLRVAQFVKDFDGLIFLNDISSENIIFVCRNKSSTMRFVPIIVPSATVYNFKYDSPYLELVHADGISIINQSLK